MHQNRFSINDLVYLRIKNFISAESLLVKTLSRYKAWILDFDGTLFNNLPVRIFMAIWLLIYYLPRPLRWKELFILREYRRLREKLFAADSENCHELQLKNLSERYNISTQEIWNIINSWTIEKPKFLIKKFQREKLITAIKNFQAEGKIIVIYSDNPVAEKIKALDFVPNFYFWSDDDLIKCMKPNPQGLNNIIKFLKLNRAEILYIGDRDDRDGACAKNANVDYCDVKEFIKIFGELVTTSDQKINRILITLVEINIFIWAIGLFFNKPPTYGDFLGQWKLCAYALRGLDPYPLIGVEIPVIEELGIIPNNWGTTPWGLLLGNLFYPGFLPMKIAAFIPTSSLSIEKDIQAYREINFTPEPAEIYFIILNVIILLATSIIIFKHFKILSRKLAWTSCLLSIFSFSQLVSLNQTGNAGSIICCLLILVCLLQDRYPKLSGIFLALAMVKPQLALIFCLTLLIMRRFKILFIAAAIDIAAWLIVSFMLQKSPMILFMEFLSADTGGSRNYSGIFTLFTASDYNLAMGLSMLAGIIYVVIGHKFLKDCKISAFKFVPACIASTFWCYSFYNEFYILLLPVAVCIYIMVKFQDFDIPFISVLFMTFGIFLWLMFFEQISTLLGNVDWNALFSLGSMYGKVVHLWIVRTFFEVGVILIGIYICRRLKNILRN